MTTDIRAALAEPEPPAAGEVVELVACLSDSLQSFSYTQRVSDYPIDHWSRRAADLLSRLAPQPVPEGPTDDDLLELMPQQFRDDLATVSRLAAHGTSPDVTPGIFRVSLNTGALDYARAVLARWGTSNLAQVRSSLSLESEGLSDKEILEWANYSDSPVPPEYLDPDMGGWQRCFSSEEFCATVRAALKEWGTHNLAQARSSLGDAPQPVPEGPTVMEIIELHTWLEDEWRVNNDGEDLPMVDFARAVLARWGRP